MALIIPSILLVLLLAIGTWPATELKPRDLPVGIVGPSEVVGTVSSQLEAQGFRVDVVVDQEEAEASIRDRDMLGAFVLGPDGPTTLVASAASPVVAQALTQIGAGLASAQSTTANVVDLVPFAEDDPRGAGFGAALQPILLSGVVLGIMVWLSRLSRRPGLLLLGGSSVVLSLITTLVLTSWLGVLPGNWFAVFSALLLAQGAVAATTLGLASQAGFRGIALSAFLMIFIGLPLSGVTSAPELLPAAAWASGALLPPASVASLVRGVSYFDGAGIAIPVLILVGWLAFGLVMALAPSRRRPSSPPSKVVAPNARGGYTPSIDTP
jgi:hypothetical protein